MKIYISNYLSRSISIIDCYTFEVEKEIFLEDNICSHHFCVDKENDLIYIPSSSDGVIYILDMKTYKILDTVSAGGDLTQIALCNDELYIANEDSNSIYILDKEYKTPVGVISLNHTPHGLEFDNESNKLYVSCIKCIVCIDVLEKSIYRQIDIDSKAWHLKINKQNNELYVSTLDGKVLVYDLENLDLKATMNEFLLPVEIRFNYKYKKVYISDLGYNTIKILDIDSGKYSGKIDVDGIPQGLELSKDEHFLFVSDTYNNSIKIYNCINNELIKEVKVGKEPTTIICV